jgi:hypothetical protein
MAGGLSTHEFFLAWFEGGKTNMHLCSTLFGTERLREIGGFNSKHQLFQDVMAQVQLAARFGRLDIQEAKASFRHHQATRTHAHKISAWCEDSLMLLDLMCDLVPEHGQLIRRKGREFFVRHNYRLASHNESPVDRMVADWVVFRAFGYPVGFHVARMSRRLRKALRPLKSSMLGWRGTGVQ